MAKTLDPKIVDYIKNKIDLIESQKEVFKDLLVDGAMIDYSAHSIGTSKYKDTNPAMINTTIASRKMAVDSFNLQTVDIDGDSSPRRIAGIIEVSIDSLNEVHEAAKKHNDIIEELKLWLKLNVGDTGERSRYIHLAKPRIIIASLYRHIKVAPESCYRVSYNWSKSQISIRVVDHDDIEEILEYLASLNPEVKDQGFGVSSIEPVEDGYEYVQIKHVKVHPQQCYYHSTPTDGKKTYKGRDGVFRVTLKANNCLIVPRSTASEPLKHTGIPNYKQQQTRDFGDSYKSILPYAGIYVRKKKER